MLPTLKDLKKLSIITFVIILYFKKKSHGKINPGF